MPQGNAQAQASILDTDFWCRTYGCVVVSDRNNYDIYDNYVFARNRCCVGRGQPLISYYNRSEDTFQTGTLNNSNNNRPTDDQSFGLGICLLYTSPSPRDQRGSRMPSSA